MGPLRLWIGENRGLGDGGGGCWGGRVGVRGEEGALVGC